MMFWRVIQVGDISLLGLRFLRRVLRRWSLPWFTAALQKT